MTNCIDKIRTNVTAFAADLTQFKFTVTDITTIKNALASNSQLKVTNKAVARFWSQTATSYQNCETQYRLAAKAEILAILDRLIAYAKRQGNDDSATTQETDSAESVPAEELAGTEPVDESDANDDTAQPKRRGRKPATQEVAEKPPQEVQ